MGKITDAVLAVIVLVIGLYVITRLGITWSGIWHMLKTFFSSSPPTNSTASSIFFGIFGLAATNSEMRKKRQDKIEELKRNRVFAYCINIPHQFRKRIRGE